MKFKNNYNKRNDLYDNGNFSYYNAYFNNSYNNYKNNNNQYYYNFNKNISYKNNFSIIITMIDLNIKEKM